VTVNSLRRIRGFACVCAPVRTASVHRSLLASARYRSRYAIRVQARWIVCENLNYLAKNKVRECSTREVQICLKRVRAYTRVLRAPAASLSNRRADRPVSPPSTGSPRYQLTGDILHCCQVFSSEGFPVFWEASSGALATARIRRIFAPYIFSRRYMSRVHREYVRLVNCPR
jgi:hypothetical protein